MDVRGKSVLVFGDSLAHRGSRTAPDGVDVTEASARSGSPGDLLASYLLEAGARAARINGRVSRSAVNFWKGNNGEAGSQVMVEESVRRRPDLVFVFLGTNDLGLNTQADQKAFQLIDETFRANGATVIAIGPPAFASEALTREAVVVYQTLQRVFGDRVIDARPISTDLVTPSQGRASDGVHFASQGARVFAARLAAAVVAFGHRPLRAAIRERPWVVIGTATLAALTIAGGAVLLRRRRFVSARIPVRARPARPRQLLGLSGVGPPELGDRAR